MSFSGGGSKIFGINEASGGTETRLDSGAAEWGIKDARGSQFSVTI